MEVPVRVLRVFLRDVTSFWSTFVLGGNVTFCGMQVPRESCIHKYRLLLLGLSGR